MRLRCLIDKVVVDRRVPDMVHCRVVWKGGDVSEADLAVTVGRLGPTLRQPRDGGHDPAVAREGKTDEEIAGQLTQDGFRSPRV